MQYALALAGATLASVVAAIPEHGHGHAHFHAQRAAEAEAEAQGHVLQQGDFVEHTTVYTTENTVQTVTAAQGWAATPSSSPAAVSAEAWHPSSSAAASSAQTSFATSAKPSTTYTSKATAASSAAASSSSSSSSGGSSSGSPSVKIINKCSQAIWINTGFDDAVSYAPGKTYEQAVSGSSIALKMGFSKDAQWSGKIAQVEYNVGSSATNPVFYDLSMIKGNPFGPYGMKLEMSDPKCTDLNCAPGITARSSACPAYFTEADNPVAGLSLPCSKSSMTFTACSG